MKFVDNLREKPAVKKIEKFAPAIAFLGGFGWDSITLGQMVESSDLVFLVAYYTGALILVILLSARLEHPEGWTKDRLRAAAAAQAKAAPQLLPRRLRLPWQRRLPRNRLPRNPLQLRRRERRLVPWRTGLSRNRRRSSRTRLRKRPRRQPKRLKKPPAKRAPPPNGLRRTWVTNRRPSRRTPSSSNTVFWTANGVPNGVSVSAGRSSSASEAFSARSWYAISRAVALSRRLFLSSSWRFSLSVTNSCRRSTKVLA